MPTCGNVRYYYESRRHRSRHTDIMTMITGQEFVIKFFPREKWDKKSKTSHFGIPLFHIVFRYKNDILKK